MSKRPTLYVVAPEPERGKVVPLRFARVRGATRHEPADILTLPRETSWRDVVRRLIKNPVKD